LIDADAGVLGRRFHDERPTEVQGQFGAVVPNGELGRSDAGRLEELFGEHFIPGDPERRGGATGVGEPQPFEQAGEVDLRDRKVGVALVEVEDDVEIAQHQACEKRGDIIGDAEGGVGDAEGRQALADDLRGVKDVRLRAVVRVVRGEHRFVVDDEDARIDHKVGCGSDRTVASLAYANIAACTSWT